MKTFDHPQTTFPYKKGSLLTNKENGNYHLLVTEIRTCQQAKCIHRISDCFNEIVLLNVIEGGQKQDTIDLCVTPNILRDVAEFYLTSGVKDE